MRFLNEDGVYAGNNHDPVLAEDGSDQGVELEDADMEVSDESMGNEVKYDGSGAVVAMFET